MARPKKQTVDYFPHFVKCGRTIYILENRFGNDGYAFWFKLLEILGESEGHFYDCSNLSNWEYLLAKTRVEEKTAQDIIKVLINLGKIDAGNKKQAVHEVFSEETHKEEGFSAQETPKGEESKPKEKIKYPYQDICDLWNSICVSMPRVFKLNDDRRQKIKSRCNEWGKTPEVWLQTAEDIFRRMEASDFCKGSAGWKATFDWLFSNSANSIKVMEGNYDNKQGAQADKPKNCKLGVGEYIDKDGRRTYGSGKATIPQDAPPRPGEKYCWDEASKNWIYL